MVTTLQPLHSHAPPAPWQTMRQRRHAHEAPCAKLPGVEAALLAESAPVREEATALETAPKRFAAKAVAPRDITNAITIVAITSEDR